MSELPDWCSIQPMLGDHREAVHELWADCYAEPSAEWIDAAVGDNTTTRGFVARTSSRIVGFSIVGAGSVEWAEDEHEVDLEPHVASDTVGWLRQIVVHPAVRGNGIGTELTRARLWWLWRHDLDPTHAAAVCWVREGGPDARGILDEFGFEETERHHSPYETEECPDCDGVCGCDGATYVGEIATAIAIQFGVAE